MRSKRRGSLALLFVVCVTAGVAGAARSAHAATSKRNADEVPMATRKLVTSYHLTSVEKQDEDRCYEEWASASHDKKGRITHKELDRETSKEFGGWNGDVTHSLAYEYVDSGRIVGVSGTEGGWGATEDDAYPVGWEIA